MRSWGRWVILLLSVFLVLVWIDEGYAASPGEAAQGFADTTVTIFKTTCILIKDIIVMPFAMLAGAGKTIGTFFGSMWAP